MNVNDTQLLLQMLYQTGELQFRFDPNVIDLAPVRFIISKVNDDFFHVAYRKNRRLERPRKRTETETIRFIERYGQYAVLKREENIESEGRGSSSEING